MPTDQELLEDTAGTMQEALEHIAQEDCLYADVQDDPGRPKPCNCSPCSASRVLRRVSNWRRACSRAHRLEYNPRERKIVDSFMLEVNDGLLSMILDEEGKPPSLRDWYVAVSVVRLLATNCGTEVLTKAGWKYTQYEEDRPRQT